MVQGRTRVHFILPVVSVIRNLSGARRACRILIEGDVVLYAWASSLYN